MEPSPWLAPHAPHGSPSPQLASPQLASPHTRGASQRYDLERPDAPRLPTHAWGELSAIWDPEIADNSPHGRTVPESSGLGMSARGQGGENLLGTGEDRFAIGLWDTGEIRVVGPYHTRRF